MHRNPQGCFLAQGKQRVPFIENKCVCCIMYLYNGKGQGGKNANYINQCWPCSKIITWKPAVVELLIKNIVLSADSTFDSGQGSTVYSDSQSSQQSVIYSSLPDPVPPAIQRVYSPPLSESQAVPHSLQQLGHYQQPSGVSLKLLEITFCPRLYLTPHLYPCFQ